MIFSSRYSELRKKTLKPKIIKRNITFLFLQLNLPKKIKEILKIIDKSYPVKRIFSQPPIQSVYIVLSRIINIIFISEYYKKRFFNKLDFRSISGSESSILNKKKLFSKRKINVRRNVVNDQHNTYTHNYYAPDIYLISIHDCYFYTNIDLIFHSKSTAIYCDNFDYQNYMFPEEVDKISVKNLFSSKRMDKIFSVKSSYKINEVFYINSRLVLNYSHWIIEFLPKIILFYINKKNLKVPLLLNHEIHKNCIELIFIFNKDIKIIFSKPYVKIYPKIIHHITPTAIIPFNYRSKESLKKNHYDANIFAEEPYRIVRDAFLKIKHIQDFKQKYLGARIYFYRNSSFRLVKNEKEIIKLSKSKGYTILDPSTLSITEQIAIFYYSNVIITPSGSAMANLIFSGSNLNLVYLASNNKDHGYHFYPRLANVVNPSLKIYQFLGSKVSSVHMSYSINKKAYVKFLDEIKL